MWSVASFAQDAQSTSGTTDKKAAKAEKKEAKAAEKGKAMHLTGWVKTEGGKTVFVNDKDKQEWNVQNPDTLKTDEGKHVKITAQLNEGEHSLNVQSVKMMRASKQTAQTQMQEKK
jgi:Holliday junction resolvase